ncbi:hypothetical protein [Clostridium cagae]|uniref:hypothetical protein n=1 Tax=Clostridium cagae TaxID=2080751 RepID=UPI001FA8BB97|nr:hypothetical protein [Clostridium cagae]
MNRVERRREERDSITLLKWIKTLSSEKNLLINNYINQKVDKMVWSINQALDTCIAAALIDKKDLSITEITELIIRANEYMKDSEKFLSEYGEDWIMKINELKPKIIEMSRSLLEKDFNQADSVKLLKKEFKDVPTKDLVYIFKETKEEWCKKCAELTKDDREKIKAKNKAYKEKQKTSNVITHKEVEKPVETNKKAIEDTFRIISKEITLEGKFGIYKITKNGVQAGKEYFKDLEALEAYKKEELKAFNAKIDEIKATFAYM